MYLIPGLQFDRSVNTVIALAKMEKGANKIKKAKFANTIRMVLLVQKNEVKYTPGNINNKLSHDLHSLFLRKLLEKGL